ncbi:MAG TPA: NYN domain-containing protein [Vicinamibacterales bacterium]|nr:NYN domain-containing protein [Vicinamibacterales bacterium]
MIDNQRLKIAVFIDFDNIEIGVKTTLHTQFDIAAILDGIKERGEVVTKVAYGDWKRAGDYGRLLSQHAIRMVQRNLTPGGDKNGADINLALDALEMAFTHDHINAFVIVGGDSDFITLVEKLKQYDKKVFVVGGRQFTSQVMQKNCHEFIAYENLVAARRPAVPGPRREGVSAPASAAPADVSRVIPLVKRALKVLADREVSPQLGLLKSTLLQLDSTFSERDYGVSTFRDFIEKIAKTGIITLRHSGRSMLVDAVEGTAETGEAGVITPAMAGMAEAPAAAEGAPAPVAPAASAGSAPAVVRDPEQVQQIVGQTKELFTRAAQPPRWPMYVRQIKQYLRSVDPNFDEHKWGFATIMEFLRVCQREGLLRLERDRRGQVRVFPGSAMQLATGATPEPATAQPEERGSEESQGGSEDVDEKSEPVEALMESFREAATAESPVEVEAMDVAPQVKSRRTRKSPTAGKPAPRKSTGARTTTRRRKTAVPV